MPAKQVTQATTPATNTSDSPKCLVNCSMNTPIVPYARHQHLEMEELDLVPIQITHGQDFEKPQLV